MKHPSLLYHIKWKNSPKDKVIKGVIVHTMKHSGLRSDLDTSAEHEWSITVKLPVFYFKSTDIDLPN